MKDVVASSSRLALWTTVEATVMVHAMVPGTPVQGGAGGIKEPGGAESETETARNSSSDHDGPGGCELLPCPAITRPAPALPCPAEFSPSMCPHLVDQVPHAALNALGTAQEQPGTTSRQSDSWVPVPGHLQAFAVVEGRSAVSAQSRAVLVQGTYLARLSKAVLPIRKALFSAVPLVA